MTDDNQLPEALIWAANLSQLLLLVGGTFLLAKQIVRERNQPPEKVEPWRIKWTDFALWMGLIAFSLFGVGVLLGSINPHDPDHPLSNFAMLVYGGLADIAVLAMLYGLFRARSPLSSIPLNQESLPPRRILAQGALAFVTGYPLICIAGMAWQFALNIIQQQLPKMDLPEQNVVQLIADKPAGLEIILTVLFAGALAPVCEELVFRAGVYRYLKGQFPTRVALGLAAGFFSVAHFNLLQSVPLFVVGWLLARTYERSGNIGVPMVFHALFNLNNIIMILLFSDKA